VHFAEALQQAVGFPFYVAPVEIGEIAGVQYQGMGVFQGLVVMKGSPPGYSTFADLSAAGFHACGEVSGIENLQGAAGWTDFAAYHACQHDSTY
jgi:hypothetical protein